MIELAGYRPGEDIEIKFTGLRPGEKLYEEVLSDKENTIPTENKKIMIAKRAVRTSSRVGRSFFVRCSALKPHSQ